jgi:glutaredoxin
MFYIITRDDCHWCDKAKKVLEDRGASYEAFLYSEHPMLLKLMFSMGLKTVPQIWEDNTHIGGYEDLVEWIKKNDA